MKDLLITIIPLLIFQLSLVVYTLYVFFKHEVRNLNRWIWFLIICFVNLFGPILYLLFGKGDLKDVETD